MRCRWPGESERADAAYSRHIRASVNDPALIEAAGALCDNRLAEAERLLRPFLKQHPTDVAAIRMLAEVGGALGRYDDAENLLARCLELAPGFAAARHNYATGAAPPEQAARGARARSTGCWRPIPRNPGYRNLKAAVARPHRRVRPGASSSTTRCWPSYPDQPKVWMSYGHALKTAGRQAEAIAAYRRSIALDAAASARRSGAWPTSRPFRFDDGRPGGDARRSCARADLADEDRFHFDFALGKALEDAGEYAESFAHYARRQRAAPRSVALRRRRNREPRATAPSALFTPRVLRRARRRGLRRARPDLHRRPAALGLDADRADPVQPLRGRRHDGAAGHHRADARAARAHGRAPDERRTTTRWRRSTATSCARSASEYLERTRIHRKPDAPFFIDKMPNNFAHVGLIHLILPNAKIIDARRHPLGCCFSGFKQHFARGQTLHATTSSDIGRYYRDYVELMAHFDAVLPGRVHRVIYEAHGRGHRGARCGGCSTTAACRSRTRCLRFYENDRAVRTASSEQVRQPIYQRRRRPWRHYEPWLGPLKAALGPVLDAYPRRAESTDFARRREANCAA